MPARPLKIIHCFRSPVGGIFRHVRDLVAAQSAAGHSVGIFCDSLTGGALEDALFSTIRPQLALGLTRIPMRRAITPGDIAALWRAYRHFSRLQPDILHSHGAKGGAYARIIGSLLRVSGCRVARLYCPHGGSVHYDAASLRGRVFFTLERALERLTDRLLFVSRYEMEGYREKIGEPACPTSLIYNGLTPAEFEPVPPAPGAADFLYIGMMRDLKGPDIFLEALAKLRARGQPARAAFIGDGPDLKKYLAQIEALGLTDTVDIRPPMPVREAFALGHIVVVPSRAESMPYIVLEAIAAEKPIICARVGGIPEIVGEASPVLVEPNDADALAAAMTRARSNAALAAEAGERRRAIQERFSVATMAANVTTAYQASLAP